MSFGVLLKDRITNYGLVTPDYPLRGCSSNEIESVKAAQGINRLPKVYQEFLEELGNEAGTAFSSYFYTYASLSWMKESAKEGLREENITLALSDDAFIFLDLHGKIYYFFYTDNDSDDPEVYYLSFKDSIDDAEIIKTGGTVSQILTELVENTAEARRNIIR